MVRKRVFKIYMFVICLVGIGMVSVFTIHYPARDLFSIIFYAVLAVIAETQTVFIGDGKSVSTSSAVIIAAMLTNGPTACVWVAAASICGSITKEEEKKYHIFNTVPYITIFNICNYVISIAIMSLIYFHFGGTVITGGSSSFPAILKQINNSSVILLIAIMSGILANAVMIGIYLFIQNGMDAVKALIKNLRSLILSVFFISLLGIAITSLYVAYGWFVVVLLFAPFMLARYVFSTYQELQQSYLQTVESLAFAIEAKDEYTIGHSRRVEQYSEMIADEMKLSYKRRNNLKYAALLHDIGKIGIPESILNKPGKLDEDEWNQIKTHPEKGAHIVSDIKFLSDAVEIIKDHHEWYNGTGYPSGMKAGTLSTEAMILCVADSYDAMTSGRPYRNTLSCAEAVRELNNKSGIQFAPEIVDAFQRALVKKGYLTDKRQAG